MPRSTGPTSWWRTPTATPILNYFAGGAGSPLDTNLAPGQSDTVQTNVLLSQDINAGCSAASSLKNPPQVWVNLLFPSSTGANNDILDGDWGSYDLTAQKPVSGVLTCSGYCS
jgi:hypothetical protein